jgi:hypothetical protein
MKPNVKVAKVRENVTNRKETKPLQKIRNAATKSPFKQLNRISKTTWFVIIISLWILLIAGVVLMNGELTFAQTDISNFFLP